jgi:hypothetical protein
MPRSSKQFFVVKIIKFFYVDPDPGSGIFSDPGSRIRDGKIRIRDKHPGSATLTKTVKLESYFLTIIAEQKPTVLCL